jgi:hypothetical protein
MKPVHGAVYSICYSLVMYLVVFIRHVGCAGSVLFDILVFVGNRQVLTGWSYRMMAVNKRDVTRLPHHAALELCTTRAKYRQGKKPTAVKVADNCILQQCLFKYLMMICLRLVDSFPGSLSTLIQPVIFVIFIRSFILSFPLFFMYPFRDTT